MAIDRIALGHGDLAHLDADLKIGLVSVRDGSPPTVVIATKDDIEHDFTLHLGDTFPLGEQIWKLDLVEGPDEQHLTAVFVRIG